MSVDER